MIAISTEGRTTGTERFRLGSSLVVDPPRHCILRDGRSISIEPRVMELLIYLSRHAGEVVTKRELMEDVWRTNVVDEAIQRAVSLLRSALGDSAHASRIIETVPRRGYRMLLAPSPLPSAGGRPLWSWLAAGSAAVVAAGVIILATPQPAAPPVPARSVTHLAEATEVHRVEREQRPKARPERRVRHPTRTSIAAAAPPRITPRDVTPAPTPTPPAQAMLAPPAPAQQPGPPAEATVAPQATPTPAAAPE